MNIVGIRPTSIHGDSCCTFMDTWYKEQLITNVVSKQSASWLLWYNLYHQEQRELIEQRQLEEEEKRLDLEEQERARLEALELDTAESYGVKQEPIDLEVQSPVDSLHQWDAPQAW